MRPLTSKVGVNLGKYMRRSVVKVRGIVVYYYRIFHLPNALNIVRDLQNIT